METGKQRRMGKTRALLTETEREQIAGEHVNNRRYQATSRVRRRVDPSMGVEDELTVDIEVPKEHHPDLLEEIRTVVCEENADG